MSERQPARALDQVAQKWRDLADRRRVHFVELYHSGRWKHYYSEEQFLNRMREAIRAAESWALIAPRPADTTAAEQPAPGPSEAPRTAA
jgi:uncharacterized repeat protein (TIGR03809 family)